MGLAPVGASVEGTGVGVLWAPTAVGQRGLTESQLSLLPSYSDSTCGGVPTG